MGEGEYVISFNEGADPYKKEGILGKIRGRRVFFLVLTTGSTPRPLVNWKVVFVVSFSVHGVILSAMVEHVVKIEFVKY